MKFDVDKLELFTDDGEFIKGLHCPLRMRMGRLGTSPGSPHWTCAECDHPVLNTAVMSDVEVLAEVRADPSTCLCLVAGQKNLTVYSSDGGGVG